MKQYRTIPLLLFCLCLLLFPACASKEEKEIRKEVEKELDGLKETEPETIQDYTGRCLLGIGYWRNFYTFLSEFFL